MSEADKEFLRSEYGDVDLIEVIASDDNSIWDEGYHEGSSYDLEREKEQD